MENNYTQAFAKNLKELMGDMSVSELSRQTGIHQQTLSRYLLCQREVSLTYLCKLADYFEESIDAMIGRREY